MFRHPTLMKTINPPASHGNQLFRRVNGLLGAGHFKSLLLRYRLSSSLERADDYEITGIPINALQGSPLSHFSVSARISWAENRETKRKEDKAYSLMGLFDISMPLIYGKGREKAFIRLHDEIDKHSRSKTMSSISINDLYKLGKFYSHCFWTLSK